jgi:hypothetical protein
MGLIDICLFFLCFDSNGLKEYGILEGRAVITGPVC